MSSTQLQLVWTEHNNFNEIVSSFDFRDDLDLSHENIYCGKFSPSFIVNGKSLEIVYFKNFSYEDSKFTFILPNSDFLKFSISEPDKKSTAKFTIVLPGK